MLNFAVPGWALSPMALGSLWFILSLILDNVNDVVMKYVGNEIGSQQIIFMRFLSSTVLLLPLVFRQYQRKIRQGPTTNPTHQSAPSEVVTLTCAPSTPNTFAAIGLCLLGPIRSSMGLHILRSFLLYMGMILWCFGLRTVPIAMATSINFTIPIFILIFARFFLKEDLTVVKISSTILGFLGTLVVIDPWGQGAVGQHLFGAKMLLISAMLFAFLDVVNKRFVDKESTLSMLFYSGFFVTLFSALPAWLQWVAPSLNSVLLLAALGGTGNLILYCLLKSFSYVNISSVSSYRYLELMFSACLGYLVFSEIPQTTTYLGAALIALSTLLLMSENRLVKRFRSYRLPPQKLL